MSVYRTMLSIIRIMPHLEPEAQRQVIRMVEEWGPKLECIENGTTLVDDATIQAIVAEQRATVPSSMTTRPDQGSGPAVVRGSGWQPPPKPEDRSRQFAVFDAMVDGLIGGANDTSKLR